MKVERVENMCGGKGHVIIKHILGEKELNGKCGLYAEVVIEPGCSLGYHEHHGESETYYILSGEGEYFGEDVEVVIDYEFRGERKTVLRSRPGTFTPSPGYRYTAQLNFIGDAFVLQFVVDNSEAWEDGELADGDDSNDDIIFE